jgi:hypothetical protein
MKNKRLRTNLDITGTERYKRTRTMEDYEQFVLSLLLWSFFRSGSCTVEEKGCENFKIFILGHS